jgi:hypothetical protein
MGGDSSAFGFGNDTQTELNPARFACRVCLLQESNCFWMTNDTEFSVMSVMRFLAALGMTHRDDAGMKRLWNALVIDFVNDFVIG